jgi:hypothetical protein
MKVIIAVWILIVVLASIPLRAEIEKPAEVCDTGICLHWWPKLSLVAGWHQDSGSSKQYGVNAQAPDGYTFSNAETVIYAKAAYKPRIPKTKSLEMFISELYA